MSDVSIIHAQPRHKSRHVFGRFVCFFWVIPVFGILFASKPAVSQEFRCTVSINTRALTGSDFEHLNDLKQQIEEYLNDRSWTDDSFQREERIQCNITITFTGANITGIDQFTARLTIGLLRPIYGTPTSTTVFQYQDDNWTFEYDRNQSLFYDPERYHPLGSIIDFYANVMLGYDYDTFSDLGGSIYLERARRIAEIANGAGAAGWNAISDDRNRGALIDQLLDPRMQVFRSAMYTYYLNGLDLFLTDLRGSRDNVITVLETIKDVHEQMAINLPVELFFAAKKQELAAVFEDSSVASEAYGLLLEVDPQNASTYDRLVQ